ncbi:MAG: cysteine hydrolase [Chloroflexi bacterium]|nr:cysteine hydrolase [Chloroflexota bacterium]
MIPSELNPNKSALLLLDMQEEFLKPEGALARAGLFSVTPKGREEVITNARKVLEAARRAGRPVVHIQTVFRPGHPDCYFAPLWRQAIISDSACLVEGSRGAAIPDEIGPEEEEFVIAKKGHSAFQHTYLDRHLGGLGVDNCIVLGNLLGAMDETLRQGSALGYENVLVTDASYPLKSPHLETLGNRASQVKAEEAVSWIGNGNVGKREPTSWRPGLIIVDLQNDHNHPEGFNRRMGYGMTPWEQTQEIIRNNNKLSAAMRAKGFPVIYIQSVRGKDDIIDTAGAKSTRRNKPIPLGESFIIEGTWGAEILADLDRQESDFVVRKRGHSAFGTTHLHRMLRNLEVNLILVTGGAITGCGSDTTREGVGLGYRAIVIPDAMYSPESREKGIPALASRAEVMNTDEVLPRIARDNW